MSHTISALIEHESNESPSIAGPARVVTRDFIAPGTPTEFELNELQWGQKLNGPRKEYFQPGTAFASQPRTPKEIEQSGPATPYHEHAVEAIVQSWNNPPRNKWRLLGAGIMMVMAGLADAAAGAVLPYMEGQYDIGYATVSLIFVAQAVGFIVAAPLVHPVDSFLGRSKSYILCNVLLTTAFAIITSGPVFPLVVFSFFMVGFGSGMYLSMTNIFIVNLINGTTLIGFIHALYGSGGILSPVIATSMIAQGAQWHYFYAIPLGLSVLAMGMTGWSFRKFEEDASQRLLSALEETATRTYETANKPTSFELLKRAFKEKTTLLGATFILFYQGAEVAISGWVISFLINYRQEDPVAAGNVTSGFWAGVTLGRIVLTPFAPRIGEKLFVYIAIVAAAGLQIIVWLVPNLVGAAVAQSLAGLALGPIYPCTTAVLSKLLPRSVALPALSFVTSMGASGGALVPLITGLMAQKLGTVVLHPIVLFSTAAMTLAWVMLPKIVKRTE